MDQSSNSEVNWMSTVMQGTEYWGRGLIVPCVRSNFNAIGYENVLSPQFVYDLLAEAVSTFCSESFYKTDGEWPSLCEYPNSLPGREENNHPKKSNSTLISVENPFILQNAKNFSVVGPRRVEETGMPPRVSPWFFSVNLLSNWDLQMLFETWYRQCFCIVPLCWVTLAPAPVKTDQAARIP